MSNKILFLDESILIMPTIDNLKAINNGISKSNLKQKFIADAIARGEKVVIDLTTELDSKTMKDRILKHIEKL
jgi:hypothetical protein